MIPLMISYDIIYIVIISNDSLCTVISLFDWNTFDQKIDGSTHDVCQTERNTSGSEKGLKSQKTSRLCRVIKTYGYVE